MNLKDSFYSITPDEILTSVERMGLYTSGRLLALNSYENRVYEVELDQDTPIPFKSDVLSVLPQKSVVKFYRPGRWSREQIQDEHDFLNELLNEEIPAVPALKFPDGNSIQTTASGIFYSIFPKVGGRSPDEFNEDELLQMGRLLARLHSVGSRTQPNHRLTLNAASYAQPALKILLEQKRIPHTLEKAYVDLVEKLTAIGETKLSQVKIIRTHGDCHLGNILWNKDKAFFLDFDDMVNAPAVQDLWLMTSSRSSEQNINREILLEGYTELRPFDRNELHVIEYLRALRIIHFSGWIARRWDDPSFPKAFPRFNTEQYWQEEYRELSEIGEHLT